MTKGNIYRIDLARMFAVHPNTIRLYAKIVVYQQSPAK